MNAKTVERFFVPLLGHCVFINITKNTITGLPTGDEKFRHHRQQLVSGGVAIDFPNRVSRVKGRGGRKKKTLFIV